METDTAEHIYDQHLVLRCQQNEPEAFDELLKRWQERLWRHARWFTGDYSIGIVESNPHHA